MKPKKIKQKTAMMSDRRRWMSMMVPLVRVQRDEYEVDEFDEDEGHDDAAHAEDQHIASKNRRRTGGTELHATQGQGNQRNDDQGVKDNGRQHRALGTV